MTVTAEYLPALTGYWKRRAAFRRQMDENNARLRAYLAECQASNTRP